MTVTWLPDGSTGTVTAASVWLPDPVPPSPVVLRPALDEPALDERPVEAGSLLAEWFRLPMTVTWLPETAAGAWALAAVWFPDTSPLAPDVVSGVSAADADAVTKAKPRTVNPPAIAVAHSVRRTDVCMTAP
jgi:hypothetical protein